MQGLAAFRVYQQTPHSLIKLTSPSDDKYTVGRLGAALKVVSRSINHDAYYK